MAQLSTSLPFQLLNKSFATNLVACIVVASSMLVTDQTFSHMLSNIGFFALSGALTNWLAIHMLFEKVPFLYGSGVIQSQFTQFKVGIKKLMMDEFFHAVHMKTHPLVTLSHTMLQQLKDKINYEQLYQSLMQEIQNSSIGAMLSMFGGQSAFEKIKEPIQEKIKIAIEKLLSDVQKPEILLSANATALFQQTVEQMIDARLAELTPQHVKEIIQKMIKAHLGWLVVWGGVLGGLMGLVKSLV